MTVSVCMGIYNGEKYIEKQLQTILKQSKPADEVILCDDGSTDNTVEIVEKFIQSNGLTKTWKLYQNKENKGYPENFYYAMGLCTQEIVFLADQDDIWDVYKIEKMCEVLVAHPDISVICCKFGLIDAEENRIYTIMQPTVAKGTSAVSKISIEKVFYKYEWPGMVMAYRRGWYEGKMSKMDSPIRIPHDFLICALAAEENSIAQIDMELAYHRRHDNNAGEEEHRLRRLLSKERKLYEIKKYVKILNQFKEGDVLFTQEGKNALNDKWSSMQGRYEALMAGKVSGILNNAWKNREYIRGATVVCDIIINCIKV